MMAPWRLVDRPANRQSVGRASLGSLNWRKGHYGLGARKVQALKAAFLPIKQCRSPVGVYSCNPRRAQLDSPCRLKRFHLSRRFHRNVNIIMNSVVLFQEPQLHATIFATD